MAKSHRFRLDDLRRYASALGAAAGLAPDRAAILAGHRLWYDTAGFPTFGVARLTETLDRIRDGQIDPHREARISHEHPATAVVDGRNGVPPLILARAAAIAAEKAREIGVAVVRVGNIGPVESAAGIAAEVAIGPTLAILIGPRPSWTLAMPSAEGLPWVLDTDLASSGGHDASPGTRPAWVDGLGPWSSVLAPDGGWLVMALAVAALESLSTFQERVASALATSPQDASGGLRAPAWEASRREARERGVLVARATLTTLHQHAERLGVAPIE